MLAEGRTNVDMATTLGVSVHAVKFHLASIYRKLDVSNRTEAAVTYLRSSPRISAGSTGE
jgi:DNA-binding CsgD family transcriptional regulator